MTSKPLLAILLVLVLLSSACAAGTNHADPTVTPEFFTATLPLAPTPEATFTPPPPTAVPTLAPIEGTTSTQVNVRAEPSITSAVLGMILPSAKVQVTGKDASGTWYQVMYPQSPLGKGWVIAAYVQVTAGTEVPVIQVGSVTGSAASVLVVQRVNVRTGPGTQFETVGMLSPNDVVALTGKDSSGAWLQIEYAAAPEGRGWINTEFVRASGTENVPIVAQPSASSGTAMSSEASSTPAAKAASALDDADSADAPSIAVAFSPITARALQFSSDVSAPQGDPEDWVQFTPYGNHVQIHVSCSGNTAIGIALLASESVIETNFACEETRLVTVQAGQVYLIHIAAARGDVPSFTVYTLKIKQLP